MSRTKFMGIFLIILGVISVVVGIVRGDTVICCSWEYFFNSRSS